MGWFWSPWFTPLLQGFKYYNVFWFLTIFCCMFCSVNFKVYLLLYRTPHDYKWHQRGKQNYQTYTEEDLEKCVQDVINQNLSTRKAAKVYKIPQTTLKGNPNSQGILNWIIQILHYYYSKQHKNIENSQIIEQNLVIFSLCPSLCLLRLALPLSSWQQFFSSLNVTSDHSWNI